MGQQTSPRELPDNLRVPLDELDADIRYLFARVANGTMGVNVASDSVRAKLALIREASIDRTAIAPGN